MRRNRSTKIIATLGPASSNREMIEKLFLSGVDVFRLNFSHGSHETHQMNVQHVRAVAAQYQRPIAILQDLQGPKLRIGMLQNDEVMLKAGQTLRLDLDSTLGTEQRVCLPHPEIFAALQPETELLIDDGRLRLRVKEYGPDYAETIVEVGGRLSNRKGVNVPGVALKISPLTEKDRRDLDFGLQLGVDWIALSFVQCPKDVLEAQQIIQGRAKIMSKLEKPQAIEQLDAIIGLSDAVMVARGDLGVEMPAEDVPILQRRIIRICRAKSKPVVVATQMLESMVHTPTPTRAETSDVATAVYDGVDAVMLSAESASGQYPVESVTMMNRIIERTESDHLYHHNLEKHSVGHPSDISDAIAAAARQVSHMIDAKAIVCLSATGRTAYQIAYERPVTPIVVLTPQQNVANQLALVWGCHALKMAATLTSADIKLNAADAAMIDGFAKPGDQIVLTTGTHITKDQQQSAFDSGTTQLLQILTVGALANK